MRRSIKGAFGAGILGGLAYAGWRAWRARVPARPQGPEWSSAPFPFPPIPRPARAPQPRSAQTWVEPDADGTCPATHTIKAKLGSGIYHVPGGLNYDRTKADRCYADESSASADGLRQSKT